MSRSLVILLHFQLLLTYLCNGQSTKDYAPLSRNSHFKLSSTKILDRPTIHKPSQGFMYEVRFPPSHPKNAPRKETETVILVEDNMRSESVQTNSVVKLEDKIMQILQKEMQPTKTRLLECDPETSTDPSYLSPEPDDYSERPGGYVYKSHPNELTVPNDQNDLHFSNDQSSIVSSGDTVSETPEEPVEILPEGSSPVEVIWRDRGVSEERIQHATESADYFHTTQDSVDAMTPETYSVVRFTASVFTEEGLPALGPEKEFPVDYRFFYKIHGQPELGHEETRVDDTARGRYWAELPDGRFLLVQYTADHRGYRPSISYRNKGDPDFWKELNML